jgi:hypothetical protein
VIVPAGLAFNNFVMVAILIAALYFTREILVPIALAVLLSFVLSPVVKFFQRWHLPRWLSVVLTVSAALTVVLCLATMVMVQVNQLASDLPRYQTTLGEKVHNLRDVLGSAGLLKNGSSLLRDLGKELEAPAADKSATPPALQNPSDQTGRRRDPAAGSWRLGYFGCSTSASGLALHDDGGGFAFRDLLLVSVGRPTKPFHQIGWQRRY